MAIVERVQKRCGSCATHEVRASRDGVAGNDCSADAGHELLAGDDLLAHKVTAALGLHLVLNVAGGETGADVLGDGARDHGRATESVTVVECVS